MTVPAGAEAGDMIRIREESPASSSRACTHPPVGAQVHGRRDLRLRGRLPAGTCFAGAARRLQDGARARHHSSFFARSSPRQRHLTPLRRTTLVDPAHIFLVLLRVRALPAHGDPPEVRDQGGVLRAHVSDRAALVGVALRDEQMARHAASRGRDGHRALRLLLGDGGVIRHRLGAGHHARRTDSAGSAFAAPPANATTRFVNWRAAAASRR